MRQTVFIVILAALAGCQSTKLEGLEGRWQGKITCFGFTSDLNMSISVDKSLSGKAQIRTKENNTQWDIEGGFETSCAGDVCSSDKDCPRGFTSDAGQAGELRKCKINKVCEDKYKACVAAKKKNCVLCGDCAPCQLCAECNEGWLPLKLVFHDEQVILSDPTFKLWQYGDALLKGTIKDYCPDEVTMKPDVEVRKD